MATTRRRGEHLDAAIRSAVLDLLATHGPDGVTMEAVAVAAHTSKPVLYRRWPDRRALLRDTLISIAATAIPTHDTGSFRGDM
ncbi:MAG: helix-turn-helix domain-containing protein, partial [Dietzia sp.]|nr:helix-turn-helix domain-containing protein [Dietzia sp.]